MNIKDKKINWGVVSVVIGSWLGAMIMLFVMYDMMLSMRAMRGYMGDMSHDMREMKVSMNGMGEKISLMSKDM
ncbi:MAG: hypothetical protein AB2687_17475, partial [Candidatus Thiodiazotropha taylori]